AATIDLAGIHPSAFVAELEGVQLSAQDVKNFASGVPPIYPMTQGLWLNSVKGFANVVDVAGPPRDDELSLLTCVGGGPGAGGPFDVTNPSSPVHQALQASGFVPLDPGDVVQPALTNCSVAP